MPSLYEAGWRQGSIVAATLPFDAVVVDPAGQVIRQQGEHERWVVATQECDLNLTEPDDAQPTIELRAVHADDPPQDWGLRSSRFRLTAPSNHSQEAAQTALSEARTQHQPAADLREGESRAQASRGPTRMYVRKAAKGGGG
jgi:hypothetical protein